MTKSPMKRCDLSHIRALGLLSVASATALATAFVAQPAWAQQGPAQTVDSIEEIIVTAQKREERLQDVPMSISVLGGKVLDKQATGGALEALSQVPGISQTAIAIGNATAITIRGVAPGSPFLDGSPTVGYYIDSIPFGLVKSAIVPNTNAYDMSRVEVLRGPQGTLYGASALNGVVRLLTNDADPTQFEAKARTGISSTKGGDASYRADAAVNIPIIEDKLALRIVAGVERLGGWIEQPALDKSDVNRSLSKTLRIKVNARPTDHLTIDLAAWISREKSDASSYADKAGDQSTPLPIPATMRYDAYSGKVVYELPFMSVSSATSYLKLGRTSYTDYAFITPTSQLYSSLPAEVFSEELLLSSTGRGPWRWSAGAFYRDAHDDLFQTLPPVLAGPIYWRDSSKSYAGFGQATRAFADGHFEISAGLRYFHDTVGVQGLDTPNGLLPPIAKTTKFHAVTPRIVATWLPNSNLTAYASYSQGFRSGFNQSPLALLAAPGLASVEADKLHNYEVGAKGSLFDGLVTYDASAYYIAWSDVQQSGQVIFNGVVIGASINGSSASGAGSDLSVTLHPLPGLKIGGGASYNGLQQDEAVVAPNGQVLYAKGSRLAYSAALTADAFVDYAFPLNGDFDAHLNVSANYHSAQKVNLLATPVTLPYASGKPLLVNASFEIANHANQSVSIYVQNLTDWDGLMTPAPSATAEFRTRPRTVGIQFETKF